MPNTLPKIIGGCSGCLVLVLFGGIVLISLFYLEENWRGAHELAEAKARWQAAGFSLDAANCIPPLIPDDQNLAAIPVYKLEPDPEMKGKLYDLRLRDATNEKKHGGPLRDGNADLKTLLGRAYAKQFPGKTPPASAVAQLEALYPLIVDLRAAAPTHPEFRLDNDYTSQPPQGRTLGPITSQIAVAKLMNYHAQLALQENQPDVALDDIRINFQIARGVGKDPSLVAGLVSVGVVAISRNTIDDGLTKHAWNDVQLAQLQGLLKQSDFLVVYKSVMRGETAMFSLPLYEWLKKQSSSMRLLFETAGDFGEEKGILTGTAEDILGLFWATGWWDMNAAQMADLMFDEQRTADIKARRVDPMLSQQLEEKVEKAKGSPGRIAPWNLLYLVAVGPMTSTVEKFARAQVQVDEDRVVCGLERYRLKNGVYPPKLDALAPAFIDELPHDVMNGEPYHYRLNSDGIFVLYSVGWNQVDDGGHFAYTWSAAKSIDYEKGDWPWPMVKK